MNYITSKPITTNAGTARVVSRAELLRSPHAEVRQGAARFRGFVFGGVSFVPMIADSAYSGRASLSGLPGVADPRQPSQRTLLPYPVPAPVVPPPKPVPPPTQPRKPGKPRPPTTPMPGSGRGATRRAEAVERFSPVSLGRFGAVAAVTACGFLLLAILGVALWPLAEQPRLLIASPMCDARVEVCP